MSRTAITEQRYFTIRARQDEPRFGQNYQPCLRATRTEAPRVSIASRLFWSRHRRDVHSLSEPETGAILLAFYHPDLFDLHEQRMLSPEPRSHPLTGHPLAHGTASQSLKGSVYVAERMGLFKWHPTVKIALGRTAQELLHVPFPWVGDLLLFINSADGPYCVNWNVKSRRGDHCKPFELRHNGKPSARMIEHARARHAVEIAYYEDAGIRTQDASLEDIPKDLFRNLRCLYGDTTVKVTLSRAQVSDVEAQFTADMANGWPPEETYRWLLQSQRIDYTTSRIILYQAIWARRLRVDLMQPVLANKPLKPERTDALAMFSHWFGR